MVQKSPIVNVLKMIDLVDYQDNAVVSKRVVREKAVPSPYLPLTRVRNLLA